MAWVPGGKVMANVSGSPSLLAWSAKGLIAFESAPTLPFHSVLRVMAWPFRFISHGMTIGFFGEPARPMVDASGMPMSMCVAWMEPVERLSRMAAQLAPFVTVELMPYFLKKPFSCAMTMGEQSVSAIMPKRRSGVSGALLEAPLLALALAAGAAVSVFFASSLLQPGSRSVAPAAAAPSTNLLRENELFMVGTMTCQSFAFVS